MKRPAVMHLTDTLDAGGAERVAVNLVNLMPRDRYRPHLCTTRQDGVLEKLVAADVGRVRLERRSRFDVRGLRRLVKHIRQHDIRILHAHGTSLFIAAMASFFSRRPAVVWHDHSGNQAVAERSVWPYRVAAKRVKGVIAVNQLLADWSRHRLGVPSRRIWYVPNFVCENGENRELPNLPGELGNRVVCVGNLRPQKDHPTLLRAMTIVIRESPAAHLLLVGAASDRAYHTLIRDEISQLGLQSNVSLLGQRSDVHAILRSCDIGVLSSASEGLPLALIEYGMAGLPSVSTRVGQCAEVLDEGQAGILTQTSAPEQLANAILSLLQSRDLRRTLGERFCRRTQELYSPNAVVGRVWHVYDALLDATHSEQKEQCV